VSVSLRASHSWIGEERRTHRCHSPHLTAKAFE
jgi:hypothetical protein